jgi:signal transduction histidine kinase
VSGPWKGPIYKIQSVDVQEAVNAVLLEVEPQLAAKGVDDVGDIPAEIPVAADPDKLHQILLELVSNAIKFTERGGYVMVDVGFPLSMPADVVMIRVTDSGCGIPREKADEIFEPRQLRSASAGNAGRGLAISRALARGMGGDLRVRSEEGQGAVFTLTLPRGG